MKHMTLKNALRLLILVGLVGLSYFAGHIISVITNQRLYDNSFSLIPLASWQVTTWATNQALVYGLTGALMGFISWLCLMYCRDSSLKYNLRNKRFVLYVVIALIFHFIALGAGVLVADFPINIFYNSLLHWHIVHLIPLLVIQVAVLAVCLLFPTKHRIRF